MSRNLFTLTWRLTRTRESRRVKVSSLNPKSIWGAFFLCSFKHGSDLLGRRTFGCHEHKTDARQILALGISPQGCCNILYFYATRDLILPLMDTNTSYTRYGHFSLDRLTAELVWKISEINIPDAWQSTRSQTTRLMPVKLSTNTLRNRSHRLLENKNFEGQK